MKILNINNKIKMLIFILGIMVVCMFSSVDAKADDTMNVSVDIVWKDSNNIHNTRPENIEMWLVVDGDKAYTSGTLNVYQTSFIFEDVSVGDGENEYNYDIEVVGVSENVYSRDVVKYGKNKFVVVYTLNTSIGENGEVIIPANDGSEYAESATKKQSEVVVEEHDYLGQNSQEETVVNDDTTNLDDTPKTGDEFQYPLYIGIAIGAFVVMIILGIYIFRNKKKVFNDVEEFKYVVNGDDSKSGITLTKNEDIDENDKNSVNVKNSEEDN